MSSPLSGRTAMVTGASSGIGAAIARTVLERAARIHAVARRGGMLAEVLGEETIASGSAVAHQTGLSDPAAVEALCDELEADPVDIVVCAAGTNITDR